MSPSGLGTSYVAHAIGDRSQSARTYLEKHFESFEDAPVDALYRHCVCALKETLTTAKGGVLSGKNCTLAVVGEHQRFRILPEEEVQAIVRRAAH